MAQELAYVIITPYTLYKSRTGGILARLITRTGMELVGARMFAPSNELVQEYSKAVVSANDPQDRLARTVEPIGGQMKQVGPLPCKVFLVDLQAGTRTEIWPGDEHKGLPVFLPGGEAGRLLHFDLEEDGHTWSYSLEFRGEHPESLR